MAGAGAGGISFLALLLSLPLFSPGSLAQGRARHWWEVEHVGGYSGPPEGFHFLLEKGFAVTDRSTRDMGAFYGGCTWTPVFLSTDAVWGVFQDLLRTKFLGGEIRKSLGLAGLLQKAFDRCAGKASPLYGLLAEYLAVPLLLLDRGREKELASILRPKAMEEVRETLVRIGASRKQGGLFKAPFLFWWIPSRFRPEGIYALHPALSRYWQAWKWLERGFGLKEIEKTDLWEGLPGAAAKLEKLAWISRRQWAGIPLRETKKVSFVHSDRPSTWISSWDTSHGE